MMLLRVNMGLKVGQQTFDRLVRKNKKMVNVKMFFPYQLSKVIKPQKKLHSIFILL
jgi:hypothetical protein